MTDASDRAHRVGTAGSSHVHDALTQIERHFRDLDLTAMRIATDIGISRDHLHRIFLAHVGHSVMQEVHQRRVREAVGLLTETAKSVYEIARACGYHSIGELDVHVRRLTGRLPTEIRRDRKL